MLKVNLLPHQERMLEKSKTLTAMLNYSQMGTGKTFASLATISKYVHTIVICPAYLVDNWVAEIRKFTYFKSYTYKEINAWMKEGGILLLSYERFVKIDKSKVPALLPAMVIDESHYLASSTSTRSKEIYRYVIKNPPQQLLLLTGTPLRDGADDFYVSLKMLSHLNKSFYHIDYPRVDKFRWDFMKVETSSFYKNGRTIEVKKFTGVKDDKIKEMRGILQKFGINERLPLTTGLTRVTRTFHVPCEVDKELEKYMSREVDLAVIPPSAKRLSAATKIPHTKEVINEVMEQEGCCVVFSDHPSVVEALEKLLSHKCGVITGATPTAKRTILVQQFQEGKIQVLLGTIGAMSTGINLYRSHVVIFNDLSYDAANNLQAEARVHRQGQTQDCLAIIIQRQGIDSRISELVMQKESMLGKTNISTTPAT